MYDLNYERLEFLGDSVLDLLVVEQLLKEYPKEDPGKLTNLKQSVVCNKSLAQISLHLELDRFVLIDSPRFREEVEVIRSKLSRDENDQLEIVEFQETLKILGDLFESFVGSIYQDSGFNIELTRDLIFDKILYKEQFY